jgi:8-oxo-dGTP pyrophosphatase MutT (NUDIX family)/transcriptional regulator with XRE-family HTH domain
MPPDDRTPRVPLGPIGRYLVRNLTELREEQQLTYRELSERLEQIGRPIPTLGLSRIEKGTRRVDADDLIALAIALEVSPAALVLPRDPGGEEDDAVELTERLEVPGQAARRWAAGHTPLPGADVITWRRPAFHWSVREGELADLRQRIELLESVSKLNSGNGAQVRPGGARQTATSPIPLEEGVKRPVATAIVTSHLGVLVGQRHDGEPPWTFISGEIEPGESPADAAVREVKEEADLRVVAGELIGEREHPKSHRQMYYLAATPTHGTEIFVGDSDELAAVRWVSLPEADELMREYGMFEPVREYLAQALGEA